MRDNTIDRAISELGILEKLSGSLKETLGSKPAPREDSLIGRDADVAVALSEMRRRLMDAYREIANHGYGRVAFLDEIDEDGNFLESFVYRLSQAMLDTRMLPYR